MSDIELIRRFVVTDALPIGRFIDLVDEFLSNVRMGYDRPLAAKWACRTIFGFWPAATWEEVQS